VSWPSPSGSFPCSWQFSLDVSGGALADLALRGVPTLWPPVPDGQAGGTELPATESITYTLPRSGELPAIQVGPKNVWRIERTKLEEYITGRYAATRQAVETGSVSSAPDAEAED
jgi:hypothetical protein